MCDTYIGNIPSNVGKDAKYSVVSGDAGYEIRLVYLLGATERRLLTTDAHQVLVAMVNKVKQEFNGQPGGAFYINEFRHVLVPTINGACYFAGLYREPLVFDLDGAKIFAEAPQGLQPGNEWIGPRVGSRYKLKAGAHDISYTRKDGSLEKEHCLSAYHSAAIAAVLAQRIGVVKGVGGGRIYLNEASEFFAPPQIPGHPFVYLGCLGDHPWFPNPFPDL